MSADELKPEEQKIKEEIVNISEDAPATVKQELVNLLNKYTDCFAMNLKKLGCTNKTKMVINYTNVPVRSKSYKTSLSARETIAEIVQKWKNCGIVTETSEYAYPVILVGKKTGEPRLVIDFRKLNAQTQKIPHPVPTIYEKFESLVNCTVFATLDLTNSNT